ISEMAFVGDASNAPRVTNATDYLVRHWNDASGINNPAGWNGTPAQYQTMYTTMKGLEYMGIDTFGGIDWFEDISDVIVAQQDKTAGPTNGSWQTSSGRGEPVIITTWALLTLEKVVPPPPINPSIDIEKFTNGEDADVAPGPRIRSGYAVTWTYNVTNNGNVILNNIIVIDDKLGEITCPYTTLQPGESMVCTATGTARVGQYSNLGNVTAVYENGGTVVNDIDQSHYFGYKNEPNFEVPTANPFLTAGVLGIAIVLFLRRELK
ncbi:MAG: VPXXXP-CTERM sorting domain-containing protein, partial [Methanosarcinaceae archaeon]|nr:VPXXXP-CTERM sorting domain-containing protein [Methanosarcinaceae archaeon]